MECKAQGNFLVAKGRQISAFTKLAVVLAMLLSQATAQGKPEDRVTLSIKSGTLESVLREIRRQTGYSYAFQDQWKAIARPVDIFVKDVPVEQALNLCFKDQPFTYTIISRTIVVEKRKNPQPKETIGAVSNRPPDGISGIVVNEEDKPLAGATIEILGLNMKHQADEKGVFFFKGLPAGKYEVEVSFVGYEKYRVAVKLEEGPVQLRVSLKHTDGSLDEVQVIAYGTTTERLNVGNVTTVKSTELEKQPVNDPLLAIQGLVPGMEITQAVGLPGSAMNVMIRGRNSMFQSTAPLYVVDGVPYPAQGLPAASPLGILGDFSGGNPLSFINPGDIESIDILKDAAATAIYGTQGANGVVLITTKKGKPGKTKVDLSIQTGFTKVAEKLKLLNTRQYLDMRYEAFKNDNAAPGPSDYDLTLWDTTRSTDWQKVLIGGTAQFTTAEGTVSGGNTNTNFIFTGNYHNQTSPFLGSRNLQKASGHLSVTNISTNKKFVTTFSGFYTITDNPLPAFDPTAAALQLAPDAPRLFNQDGSINWAPNSNGVGTWPTSSSNPIATRSAQFDVKAYNLTTSATVSYEIFPGLILLSSQGFGNLQSDSYNAVPWSSIDPSTWNATPRRAGFSEGYNQNWIIEPQMNYVGQLFKGQVNALTGMTIREDKQVASSYYATGFPSDQLMQDIQFATNLTPGFVVNNLTRYNAAFGRVNYNWQDNFLLEMSARRDGSSNFGPAKRFHDFYSVGAGWIFTKHAFIQKQVPWLSFGKLRGSWGTTGNSLGESYLYLDPYAIIPTGVPYQGAFGLLPTSVYNPNLEWEETRKLDAGLELGFFKERILLKADFYQDISSNELLDYPLPDITGFQTILENFDAELENKGWELELRTTNIESRNFHWASSINLTIHRNKLASGAPGLSGFYERLIGHPLNSAYVYHSLGVNPVTGVYQFADNHGAATSTPNPTTDLNRLVDPNRRYYGGFENRISYKNIQLSFNLYFVRQPQQIQYLFNAVPGTFSSLYGTNQPAYVLSRWRQPGDVSRVERFTQSYSFEPALAYAKQSDLMYSDASFIRLQNVSLSWQMAEKRRKKMGLQDLSFFVHGQNLWTLTKYHGLDPETGTYFPPIRVITFGAKVVL